MRLMYVGSQWNLLHLELDKSTWSSPSQYDYMRPQTSRDDGSIRLASKEIMIGSDDSKTDKGTRVNCLLVSSLILLRFM